MTISSSQAKPNSHSAEKDNEYRLPRTAIPEHYEIWLEPDLDKNVFTGTVAIDLNVNESTSKIVLNAKELEIVESTISNKNGAKHSASAVLDREKQFVTLTFSAPLSVGLWQLNIKFSGIHNDKLKGFYRSSWVDESGTKHALVTTQFESTDARRAFPCFDEPDRKATYGVTLTVPKHLTAISNGRVIDSTEKPNTDQKIVRFKKTMKMSTYLLAFIVGDFEPSESVLVNGIEVRAWTVPGKRHLTAFALRVAAFAINYFEDYFQVKYPDADKCDLIAIPDFASGAMENKDCITFRETALLVDESTAAHAELERVAEVVMHELAHMWFGDLVTMSWWNGLWLNEAFATFMEMKCLDNFKREWRIWDTFGIHRASAARIDSLESTHPIECTVTRPEQTQELFDVISYEKGCAVLYQIEQFIGEKVFQSGITHYIRKHSFGNTETHDLWDSLEHACAEAKINIPVRKIMDSWVFVPGHPLVTVHEDKQLGGLKIKQQQFKFLADKATVEIYPVPISMRVKYKSGQVSQQKFLFDEQGRSLPVEEGFDWAVLNAGGSGFYRVTYENDLALRLTSKVKEHLSVIERFNLVNDSWASVRAGFASATDYLDMIKLFAQEDDINVWSIIIGSLNTIHGLLDGDSRLALKAFIRDLCSPAYAMLGFTPRDAEEVQTKQVRSAIISTLGTIGEEQSLTDKASEQFALWAKDRQSTDPNLLPALVSILAYHGGPERYAEFVKRSEDAKTPQEKLRFLYSLAAFRKLDLLEKTMQSCLTDQIRTQDAPYVFAVTAQNEVGTEAAWAFLNKNWESMLKAYPENGVVRMCSAIIPLLDKPELEKQAVEFFKKHPVKTGDMAIAQALEQLKVNVLLRQREAANLVKYLKG